VKCKQQLLTTIFVAVLCLCSFGVARFRVSGSGYRASALGLIDFLDFTDDSGILADRFEACAEGFYKVMLALDTSSTLKDYHWYRQNSDGTWSHKPASGAVRNYDYDGNPIIDPEYCNKKSCEDSGFEWLGYDYEFNYSDGCAFFSVPLFSY